MPNNLQARVALMNQRGMTLIELLTVIVVLAILSSLAVSSYRRYLVRTNRTDGTTLLLRVQVAQEKYFLQNNSYTNNLTTQLGFVSDTSPQGTYKVTVAAPSGGTLATGFVATAAAQGNQLSSDPQCASLTIDDKGVRGASPGDPALCWK